MKFAILCLSNPGIWLGSVGEFDSCRHCCDLSGRGWTVPEIGQRDYCVFVGPGLFCLEEKNGWISSPFWRVIRKVCFRAKDKRSSDLAQTPLFPALFFPLLSPASVCWWTGRAAQPVGAASDPFPGNAPSRPILFSCSFGSASLEPRWGFSAGHCWHSGLGNSLLCGHPVQGRMFTASLASAHWVSVMNPFPPLWQPKMSPEITKCLLGGTVVPAWEPLV